MLRDVGIADLQKAWKQGRDDSIKHAVQYTTPPYISFHCYRYVGWGCILNCFVLICTLLPCFMQICYPYILLHF